MSEFAVRIEGLSKLYHLGRARPRHDTLRDALVDGLRSAAGWLLANEDRGEGVDTIWALKDVSFDVGVGEALGLIGRNGAGKSTLLKILSRITEPTSGRAVIRGRVGSLLEVGAGFHSELTGRENIFLNGAILGMRTAEIRRRFDEIVAFAEIEQFLDTPIKHYSSGMYMRLAFAVAAHLETEILLVDEALAVGDAAFQRKCLGRMGAVADQGRTILFVSHDMGAIQSLCATAILLKNGQVACRGVAREVVQTYLSELVDAERTRNPVLIPSSSRTKGTQQVRILSLGIQDRSRAWRQEFAIWEPLVFVYEIENRESGARDISCWLSVVDSDGRVVGTSIQYDNPGPTASAPPLAKCRLDALFEDNVLPPGTYFVNAGILGRHREILDWCEHVMTFSVSPVFAGGTPYDNRVGGLALRSRWGKLEVV